MKTIKSMFSIMFLGLFSMLYNLKNHITFTLLSCEYSDSVPVYQPDMMSTVNMTDRVNFDFQTEIFKDREDVAFVTILANELESSRMQTSSQYYFEQYSRSKTFTKTGGDTTASPSAGDTRTWALSTADLKGLIPNMTLRILGVAQGSPTTYTLDCVIVSKTSTSITVKPAKSTLKIVAVPNSTVLYQVSTRFARGSDMAAVSMVKPVKKMIITGIRKTAFGLDNTAANERMYGPAEIQRIKIEAANDHAEDLEAASLFNPYTIEATEDSNESDFQGLIPNIIENSPINKFYTTFDFADLVAQSNNVFAARRSQGGKYRHKLGLANSALLNVAWEMAQSKFMQTKDVSDVYGVAGVTRFRFPKGDVDLFEHPQMTDIYNDDNKPALIWLDLRFLGGRTFRPTKAEMNIGMTSVDGMLNQFITENSIWAAMVGSGRHAAFLPN